MIKIPLNEPNKFALIDDADYELVIFKNTKYPYQKSDTFRWRIKKVTDHLEYASCSMWFGNDQWKQIKMHRFILGLKKDDGIRVDHRDGNGLNNQRDNLRKCTQPQNMRNMRRIANSSSGFKGVSLYKPNGKWAAYINFEGKLISLGHHKSKEEAALIYNKKAIELFGEFACLNQI